MSAFEDAEIRAGRRLTKMGYCFQCLHSFNDEPTTTDLDGITYHKECDPHR